jgi:hypothetical protein
VIREVGGREMERSDGWKGRRDGGRYLGEGIIGGRKGRGVSLSSSFVWFVARRYDVLCDYLWARRVSHFRAMAPFW